MNKKLVINLLIVVICLVGCGKSKNLDTNLQYEDSAKDENQNNYNDKEFNSMKVIINNEEYIVNLEDNETVKSLIDLLPLELNMNELNGNEKYYYLDTTLPTNSKNPDKIQKGDIMLYGNDCLVVFYKSFNTSYSYTKIGHIDNLPDLGKGNIKVIFSK